LAAAGVVAVRKIVVVAVAVAIAVRQSGRSGESEEEQRGKAQSFHRELLTTTGLKTRLAVWFATPMPGKFARRSPILPSIP